MSSHYFDKLTAETAEWIRSSLKQKGTTALAIFLEGPLGAGKTTFVQELLTGHFGVRDAEVQSPTFLKLLEYKSPELGAVFHVDSYRVEEAEDWERVGLENYTHGKLWLVEWPENFEKFLEAGNGEMKRLLGIREIKRLNFKR